MILKKQRLRIITIVYWLLLVYIVAALVWWFIELERQNRQMANYKLSELRLDDPGFNQKMEVVESDRSQEDHAIYFRRQHFSCTDHHRGGVYVQGHPQAVHPANTAGKFYDGRHT